ncbi:MAG: hypothetical protein CH6_0021 [Candidatus Kapaibacterium sp.]|nr:MAG: hypothetical protein CH6_0021 [Candidatus Kapabacteria bacterium]
MPNEKASNKIFSFDWFKEDFWDFLKRHAVLIILGCVFLYFLSPRWEEIRILLLLGLLECFAIFMSGFAQWAYTKIKFTNYKQTNSLGYIFLGVHILIGLCIFGVYFVMFITP